jgi:hypothetical protein
MEVLFDFKGEIDNQVLKNILKTMDDKMEQLGEDRFLRKKINSILIECLQNLIFHAEKATAASQHPVILITREGKQYQITTQNLIRDEKKSVLTTYVDRINAMNEEELRNYYQEVLTNGKFNPQGGAGLGIINIARKTKEHKLTYRFTPSTDSYLMFEMNITV